jgi:hypothetical protein
VPYGGSLGVAQATASGDVDWGFIAAPVATKQEKLGTIHCPYSTDNKSSDFIGKAVPHLSIPDFEIITAVYTNSTDPAVMRRLRDAAASTEFQSWLAASEMKSITMVTQSDVNRLNSLIDRLIRHWGD